MMVVGLLVVALGVVAVWYTVSQSPKERQLTAEEVVDLEVQAEKEFVEAGGEY